MQSAPAATAAWSSGQRVAGVEPPAVEEMLQAFVHDLAAELLEPGHAVVDHPEVSFGPSGFEDPLHV